MARRKKRKAANSPLFKNTDAALKKAARAEHNSSELGKLIKKSQRILSGKGSKRESTKFYNELDRLSKSGTLRKLAERSNISKVRGTVDRYAKGVSEQMKQELLGELFTSLGPLGELVEALVRPRGKKMTTELDQELGAAAALVREFGGFATLPSDKAKNRKMVKYLQDQGYTVVKPVRQRNPNMPKTEARVIAPTKKGTARKVIDIKVGNRNRRFKVTDPLITGAMIAVESSNVHSIGFDIEPSRTHIGTLKVRFLGRTRSGASFPGPMYHYYGVPIDIFMDFREADSKGMYHWDKIRIEGTLSGHQYDYRLAGISRGYVPRKATIKGGAEWYVTRQFVGKDSKMQEKGCSSGGDMSVRNVGEPNRGRPKTGAANRGRP